MPRSPSTLHDHLGFWLRLVSNHVSVRFAARVEAAGVTVSEWVALRTMFDAKRTTPSTLASALGMTKGAVTKIVDRLESRGLARRVASVVDGRAHHVELTRAGRAIVPKLAAIADENDAHFFGRLAAPQRNALRAALEQLARGT